MRRVRILRCGSKNQNRVTELEMICVRNELKEDLKARKQGKLGN